MIANPGRLDIICQVHGTTLERLRKLKPSIDNDLKAIKEIASYLRNEEHKNYSEIADILFRDRTTVRHYLKG